MFKGMCDLPKYSDGCCHKTVTVRCTDCSFNQESPKSKKLTFDEWFNINHKEAVDAAESIDDADSTYYLMRQAWYAGQM